MKRRTQTTRRYIETEESGVTVYAEMYLFFIVFIVRDLTGDHAGPVDNRDVRVGTEAAARSRLRVGNAHRLPPVPDQQGGFKS